MRERAVQVGEVELSIAEAGAGGRPLLLLHGFTGSKEDFTRDGEWLDRLADLGWHAVAPDHRGHGLSSKPESEDDYSFEIFARDALALADVLGWSSFALLGHSMGGMIAQVLVDLAPERVSALVLMDTTHTTLKGLDPALAEKTGQIAQAKGMAYIRRMQDERGAVIDTPIGLRLKAERPGYKAFGDWKLESSSPAMYASMIRTFASPMDRLEALASVSVPTLVIVGDQDRPFIKASERMAAAIAGARLEVIPDAGHSPQFENPDGWWDALSSFLASLVERADA